MFDITAIDISRDALNVATKNTVNLGAEIHLMVLDFLDEPAWQQLPGFDLIVSNPPYIKQSEDQLMSRNVLDFEPRQALFVPDHDPLLFYRKIAHFATTNLNPSGSIFLEINESLGRETTALFEKEGYKVELKKDLQGKDRMLKATQ